MKGLLTSVVANATSFPDLGMFRRASLAAAFDLASHTHVSECALRSRPTECQPPRLRQSGARSWSVRWKDEYPEGQAQPSMQSESFLSDLGSRHMYSHRNQYVIPFRATSGGCLYSISASGFLSRSPVTRPRVLFRVRSLSRMPSQLLLGVYNALSEQRLSVGLGQSWVTQTMLNLLLVQPQFRILLV
jgi:hypothetical protein